MDCKICYSLIVLVVALSLVYSSSAIPAKAFFYTVYVPSACYKNQTQGNFVASVGDSLWNNGAICGKMLKVKCIAIPQGCLGSGMVTVKVVDHCIDCNYPIELSYDAFKSIGDIGAAVMDIDYQVL
ncbi:putative EG45-like domain containing protein 1 [Impatiens glandulifera]|uniref:putative EG45-like domain containing protein 1 n=1 Tax=Impatiens glandulifera TaxID=253017 RepID=UPI001FB18390|nr:putative EG45-like domain containing protein 1 [Impatiens glandulifera]